MRCTEGEKDSWMASDCSNEGISLDLMDNSVNVAQNVFKANETYSLSLDFMQGENTLASCYLTVLV